MTLGQNPNDRAEKIILSEGILDSKIRTQRIWGIQEIQSENRLVHNKRHQMLNPYGLILEFQSIWKFLYPNNLGFSLLFWIQIQFRESELCQGSIRVKFHMKVEIHISIDLILAHNFECLWFDREMRIQASGPIEGMPKSYKGNLLETKFFIQPSHRKIYQQLKKDPLRGGNLLYIT